MRRRHRPDLLDRRHAEQAAVQDRLRARQARRPDRARPRRPAGAHLAAAGAQDQRHRPEGEREARGAGHPHRSASSPRPSPPSWSSTSAAATAPGCTTPRTAATTRPVVTYSEPESISRETTFERDLHAVRDRAALGAIFTELCEQLAGDLPRKGYAGRTIGIKLRFDDFKTVTRDLTLPRAHARRRSDPPRRRRVPEARRPDPPPAPARRARRHAGDARRPGRRRSLRAPHAGRAARSRARATACRCSTRPCPIRRTAPRPARTRRLLALARDRTTRPGDRHARHHQHRRPARAGAEARAAHVLRLRRFRLVDREHLPRQRERLPEDQAAPARGGQHGEPHTAHAR